MENNSSIASFSALPAELRIKIWQYNFREPRIIPVRFDPTSNQYTTNTRPSTLLSISAESRTIYLSTYTKLILSPDYDSAVFVDFAHDTIYFDSLFCSPNGDLASDLARSPHRDRVLKCAIDAELWEILRLFRFDILSEISLLPNLRTLALVLPKKYGTVEEQGLVGRDGYVRLELSESRRWEYTDMLRQVAHLRNELEKSEKGWANGVPSAQMWLL